MTLISLHDKAQIESFVRQNTLLHLYELGDLDDFFWPYTAWYGLQRGGAIEQLALVYFGLDLPVLLAHAHEPHPSMGELLRELTRILPPRIYSHLTPGCVPALADRYRITPHGHYLKMGLTAPERVAAIETAQVERLSPADQPALEALYAASYPGNWFDARMLQTGCYFGVREENRIVAVAGVHVYAPGYGVAALGNVTTLPELRRRGLGKAVCAGLCQALLAEGVTSIGLNVRADNAAAIAGYQAIGFSVVGEYGEYLLAM